ncbi:MAG: Fur family transcriptional regulator [Candidatus Pacebacteria bacterium]|nr:Fur family transcriptional regulator [Candidatus Paceibacterota bacterium]
MSKIKNLEEILKNSNYKITKTRLAVLDILNKEKKPVTADSVYQKISSQINEATVYRILASFEKNKIIRRVNMKKEAIYFELNNHHHHHFVCLGCNLVEPFQDNKIEKYLEEIVEKSSNFKKINEHSIELFGFCRKCSLK